MCIFEEAFNVSGYFSLINFVQPQGTILDMN